MSRKRQLRDSDDSSSDDDFTTPAKKRTKSSFSSSSSGPVRSSSSSNAARGINALLDKRGTAPKTNVPKTEKFQLKTNFAVNKGKKLQRASNARESSLKDAMDIFDDLVSTPKDKLVPTTAQQVGSAKAAKASKDRSKALESLMQGAYKTGLVSPSDAKAGRNSLLDPMGLLAADRESAKAAKKAAKKKSRSKNGGKKRVVDSDDSDDSDDDSDDLPPNIDELTSLPEARAHMRAIEKKNLEAQSGKSIAAVLAGTGQDDWRESDAARVSRITDQLERGDDESSEDDNRSDDDDDGQGDIYEAEPEEPIIFTLNSDDDMWVSIALSRLSSDDDVTVVGQKDDGPEPLRSLLAVGVAPHVAITVLRNMPRTEFARAERYLWEQVLRHRDTAAATVLMSGGWAKLNWTLGPDFFQVGPGWLEGSISPKLTSILAPLLCARLRAAPSVPNATVTTLMQGAARACLDSRVSGEGARALMSIVVEEGPRLLGSQLAVLGAANKVAKNVLEVAGLTSVRRAAAWASRLPLGRHTWAFPAAILSAASSASGATGLFGTDVLKETRDLIRGFPEKIVSAADGKYRLGAACFVATHPLWELMLLSLPLALTKDEDTAQDVGKDAAVKERKEMSEHVEAVLSEVIQGLRARSAFMKGLYRANWMDLSAELEWKVGKKWISAWKQASLATSQGGTAAELLAGASAFSTMDGTAASTLGADLKT